MLDTRALLWYFLGAQSLSELAHRTITDPDNVMLVSAVSAWEIATKVGIGKLLSGFELVQGFTSHLQRFSFEELPLSVDDAIRAGLLPMHHKDPFDRMLAAQCQAESIPIISSDRIFELYGVSRIW